jgi:preprotein translocase subunit SecF
MYDIISKSKYAYIFSAILTIASLVAVLTWGLNFGIDFKGGTLMEVKFTQNLPAVSEMQDKLKNLNLKSLTLQSTQGNSLILRYVASDEALNESVLSKLKELDTGLTQTKVDFIGASVSNDIKKNAIWAVVLAMIGINLYIAWAFRKVSRPISSWQYGINAVIALIHDTLITIGVFAALGHFAGVEVGVPFIAALLTILGFSVHDTIVVFDRTRENLMRSSSKEKFPDIVNRSLNETLVRSINTSLTVIITLLAIYIFGGESIKFFALALLVGITFGTYSSFFIASALLVTTYKLKIRAKN